MESPILKLKGICKSFSGHTVLNNIDLTVTPGEIICLVGENGCGKSTLIKIISGVYEADGGEIYFSGKKYNTLIPTDSIKEGVQVIYQDFSVFPNLTVAENISLGTQIVEKKRLVNWRRMRTQAKKALEMIGVDIDIDAEVSELSVAQKQIVAISRAILQDAKLIIMDEPTTALTSNEIERLYVIIKDLCSRGISVIFVSHKLDEVFAVCKRIAVIRSGKMIVDEQAETFEKEKLIYYMTGQEIQESPFVYNKISDTPILEVRDISQKGSFKNVSFCLYPGEILGITGQLGSGRTELAKALFGIGKITHGQVLVKGVCKSLHSIHDALACRIAYVPEDRLTEGLFMTRSLIDNICAPIIDKMTGRFGLVDTARARAEAEKQISSLQVNAKSPEVLANTFSGGNQQRIVIGKWLATDPEILILNGPSVGVDVKSKSEIHRILKELAARGYAVIMISDDISELLSSTNRVMVMNGGQLIFESETSQIDSESLNQKITQSYKEAE